MSKEKLWMPRYSVGKAIEELHTVFPVNYGVDEKEFNKTLKNLSSENKGRLAVALINLYDHFGHRTDGQHKPCLVCHGNPEGF